MARERLGFALSFEPRRPGVGRRTSGRGQAIEHGPETTLYVIDLASNPACSLVMCDLASHATMQKRRRRLPRRRGASGILPTWKVPWRRRNERSLADTHGRRDGSRRNRGRRSSRAGGAFRDRVDARRSEAWREAAW